MRRFALVVLVLAAGGGLALARHGKKGKRGKVVRVERSSETRTRLPRVCGSFSQSGVNAGWQAQCWGLPIEQDEEGTVFDENGQKATIRVENITGIPDNCGNTYAWTIDVAVVTGSLDPNQMSYNAMAIFDWDGGDRGRIVVNNGQIPAPSGRQGESPMAMFDTDGDQTPELIVGYYLCDQSKTLMQYGQQQGYCMPYYLRDGGSYQEIRNDFVRSCN